MENLEYANAYSEVNEILKSISKEDYEKIPNEVCRLQIYNHPSLRFHFGDLWYWESLFMYLESYRFIIRIRYIFLCADGSFRMRNYRMKEEQ